MLTLEEMQRKIQEYLKEHNITLLTWKISPTNLKRIPIYSKIIKIMTILIG